MWKMNRPIFILVCKLEHRVQHKFISIVVHCKQQRRASTAPEPNIVQTIFKDIDLTTTALPLAPEIGLADSTMCFRQPWETTMGDNHGRKPWQTTRE